MKITADEILRKWNNSSSRGNLVKFSKEHPEFKEFLEISKMFLDQGLMFDEALSSAETYLEELL